MSTAQKKQKFKIKKGDQVIVTTGKDKGRTGEVIEVRPADARVKVQGINLVKRHRRPTQTNPGGIDQMEAPLHISNVSLIDPESGKPTRAGYSIEKGKKTRIARKSGKAIG
jgi:large subunit ribosomal protein L24